MTAIVRAHPLGFAIAGAAAAAVAWYALAAITGLIFHAMPAGPTVVAAVVVRWADASPPRWGRRGALLAAGASIALAMTLILAASDRPLDEPLVTELAIAGGVVVGAWLLRPGGRATDESARVDVGYATADPETRAYAPGMDILRLVGSSASCEHVPESLPEPQAARCQECGSGFNLRLCATCGHVGCCESQQGHARAHALGEAHPVIYQMPAPDGFAWCYEERAYVG